MHKKVSLSRESEWLLFACKEGQKLYCLLQEIVLGAACLDTEQASQTLAFGLSRMRALYPRASAVLEPAPLLLLLAGLREKECSELEIPLYKYICEIGKNERPEVYKSLCFRRRKLPHEGWVFYAVKDIAGDRGKQAKQADKELRAALWEDIKAFGPHWNALHGYAFARS
ncbi:uncharacterized protein NEMAJ01_1199 [Nematocida major]|uniref:uncharacterized protein n=1 Tax=Nematocida major TaxID=1912982 RepID=UPI002007E2E9|nr:uncharacterized protein NEMAJ01_1199 [Nematocida major]KAH9386303.1 hypothetical protein NEMAJ01_1199 [Nematocida major]